MPDMIKREECMMRIVERRILREMYEKSLDAEWGFDTFFHFGSLVKATGLTREYVRAACRRLTDRGLARYSSGLVDADGRCGGGSGYGLTERGVEECQT